MATDDYRAYRGERMTVRWSKTRCIHAAECVSSLPSVFDTGQRPWIQPDAAAVDELERVVRSCPTGALVAERTGTADGERREPPPDANCARMVVDGPLYLHGDFRLGDARETRLALCRCGASRNKPYCDGNHVAAEFCEPAVHPAVRQSVALEPGAVQLDPTADGPVTFAGPLTIRGADDEVVFCGTRGALCRCGGSGSPPLCDGSHYGNGFTSD